MKKFICLVLIFLGSSILLVNIVNNFSQINIFYASLNPEKYYYPDFLIIEKKVAAHATDNWYHDLYIGYCKSDKTKAQIIKDEYQGYHGSYELIPIWRIRLVSKEILYRGEQLPPDPFSYTMRDYWLGALMIILLLPAIIYYIYLKRSEKLKSNKDEK